MRPFLSNAQDVLRPFKFVAGCGDLLFIAPTYTFATPVLGGQLAVGVTGIVGNLDTSITGTLTVYPLVTLQWNQGVHNYLNGFKSRVFGFGPQLGYLFPIGDKQRYLNFKGYREFASENRPEGWNVWLTFAISNAAPTSQVTPTRHSITK